MSNTNFQTIHQMGNAISNVMKQAMGRDNVQNIDMDFVTVAQRKRLVEEIITGNPVSFVTNIEGPLDYLIAQINPVQDLHGEDSPYPAGGGINKFNPDNVSEYNINGDTRNGHEYTAPGTYAVSAYGSGDSCYIMARVKNSDDTWKAVNYIVDGITATLGSVISIKEGQKLYVYDGLEHTSNVSEGLFNSWQVQVALSSTIPNEYHQYSNICPISGWTGCNIYVSPTTNPDDPDKVTYEVEFPDDAGTVYGGTLTVNKDGSGRLVLTHAKDTATSSNTIMRTGGFRFYYNQTPVANKSNDKCVISDRIPTATDAQLANIATTHELFCYIHTTSGGFNFNTINEYASVADMISDIGEIQFVYELATPVVLDLTASQIRSLLGVNNIWADTGDVTVLYKNYEEVI